MNKSNRGFYLLVVATIASVVVAVTGCGANTPSVGQRSFQNFGAAVSIATVGGGEQVLTYNESLDIVCLENTTTPGSAARGNMSAFSCWETRVAPQKVQELVNRYVSGKK